jgi:tetratricopeptide (TPR) repeat protein
MMKSSSGDLGDEAAEERDAERLSLTQMSPVTGSGVAAVAAKILSGQAATSGGINVGRDAGEIYTGPVYQFARQQGRAQQPFETPRVIELRGRRHRRDFTGRQDELGRLSELLSADDSGPVVLQGLGGVGKTQLAVEYVHAHRDRFDVIWMVRADALSSAGGASVMDQDYAQLASALRLPEADESDLGILIAAVRRWLSSHSRWLLLIDNVDSQAGIDAVEELLPSIATGGQMLITSRLTGWPPGYLRLPLRELDADAASQLLLAATGSGDAATARAVAIDLGGLPLAVTQAAGYLSATGASLVRYRQLFQQRGLELLSSTSGMPSQHERTVTATWTVSITNIREQNPGAAALLDLLAYLAPDAIPRTLLIDNAPDDFPVSSDPTSPSSSSGPIQADDADTAVKTDNDNEAQESQSGSADDEILVTLATLEQLGDDLALNDAVALLTRYSLLQATPDSLAVHRLVQAVVRASHTPATYTAYATAGAVLLLDQVPPLDPASWSAYQALLPHLLAVADYTSRLPDDEPATKSGRYAALRLLISAGHYQRERAQFTAARITHNRALSLAEQLLDPASPDFAVVLSALATTLNDLGEPAAARPLAERALLIDEAHYGPSHAEVARDLNDLGMVLMNLGEYAAARPLLERAVQLAETLYGPDHPRTLAPVNNLGMALANLGEYAAARPLLERAVQLAETLYGPYDVRVAVGLFQLADVYSSLGSADRAVPLLERALAIDEAAYGPEHREVATDLLALASAYRDLGQTKRAKTLHQRAEAINNLAS